MLGVLLIASLALIAIDAILYSIALQRAEYGRSHLDTIFGKVAITAGFIGAIVWTAILWPAIIFTAIGVAFFRVGCSRHRTLRYVHWPKKLIATL